ncbi:MAG TPA: methionine--tRNA ligase [Candidatus Paceibacterota bacterium]
MKKPFYITTTLPYVNAEPHVGFALELIRADVIARSRALSGHEVFFNTGTDEHGQKLFEAAAKEGIPVKQYVDRFAAQFRELAPKLGISPDIHFIRTTDAHHEKAAQEFWNRVQKNGYIYKKNYKAKYCVGCEVNKTESELVDGRCPIHPNRELEIRDEENYFFKYSEFGDRLLALYDAKKFSVVPEFRLNEMREFIKSGLEDFSISRLKTKMSWGVPVPNDPDHVMYVWFDALVNYISTLGWPEDGANFEKFWKNGTPTQYCGKDNTRFQSVMWQAMLLAAELPNTHTVVVNGFVTGEGGLKMSKSLGNVINPFGVVAEYDAVTNSLGNEALRYFVCREVGSFEDSPFTMDRFKSTYNTSLANGLGNLVSRVMKMATTNIDGAVDLSEAPAAPAEYAEALERFDIQAAANAVWKAITDADQLIQEKAPFKLVKTDKAAGQAIIADLVARVFAISKMLEPIMPKTSQNIQALVLRHKMPEAPLFLRKD